MLFENVTPNGSTPIWRYVLKGWREATSNVLKYFQESRSPPSTHELEAVTRFINHAASEIKREIKEQSTKQLEETSGNISNEAFASSCGCPETERVGD